MTHGGGAVKSSAQQDSSNQLDKGNYMIQVFAESSEVHHVHVSSAPTPYLSKAKQP